MTVISTLSTPSNRGKLFWHYALGAVTPYPSAQFKHGSIVGVEFHRETNLYFSEGLALTHMKKTEHRFRISAKGKGPSIVGILTTLFLPKSEGILLNY